MRYLLSSIIIHMSIHEMVQSRGLGIQNLRLNLKRQHRNFRPQNIIGKFGFISRCQPGFSLQHHDIHNKEIN